MPVVVLLAIFGGCVSYIAIILSVMPEALELSGYMGPFEDTHFNAILFTGLVALLVITPLNMIENLSALRPTPPLSA